MHAPSELEPYNIHERSWSSYEELIEAFEWDAPAVFNAATYCCDRWAEADGDRVALFAEDPDDRTRTLRYGELRERADRLATYLAGQGVGRGDRVGISGPQKPETLVAFVATWKLGAVVMPLSALFGTEGLRYRLIDAGASAFVVDESAVDTYRRIREDVDVGTVVTVDADPAGEEVDFDAALTEAKPGFSTARTAPEDDAAIIYTSGTTGRPKGVLHAQRYVLGNLPAHLLEHKNLRVEPDDVTFSPVEWTWGAVLYMNLFPNLYLGSPVVAYARDAFEPEDAVRLIDAYDVTVFNAPRTVLKMLKQVSDVEDYDLSSVRVVPSGGESLDRDVREWIQGVFDGVEIHEAYGQTEALPLVGSCNALFPPKEGTIGRPFPGQDVRILDPETGEPLPPGEVGEIATRYEGNFACFVEYWGKPELSAEKVVDGWLLTEDLGWMDEDGYVAYHSRKDSVIISSGYRIGPKEIEESLSAHEWVVDVAVVGVPDEERGEIPKAYVVLAAGAEATEGTKETLQAFVKDRLAKYEYPRGIEFVDELPRTSSGKVRRHALGEE